ncbi:MAG: glycosyltransferase [Wenzhouxiangella sp.]
MILFSVLAFGLLLPKLAGAGLLGLGLIAIAWLSLRGQWRLAGLQAAERLLMLAALVFVGLLLLAWLGHGLPASGADALTRAGRLLLIVPVFLFLRRVDGLASYWWHGLTVGALAAGLYGWWFLLTGQVSEFGQRAGGATNPIYFGGISLLMAFMLLPRIGASQAPGWQRALAAAGVVGGVSASLLSSSRGAWLAAVPLLAVYVIIYRHHVGAAWRFGLPLLFVAGTLALTLLPAVDMDQRMIDIGRELLASINGQQAEGGVAERIEMWRIASARILDQPWLGPGPGAFQLALNEAVESGKARPELLAYRHPHNQFLSAMLYAGLPGLLALIMLFVAPLRRFWQIRQGSLQATVHIAWCGLAAITVLATMGLSESIFERNIGVVWFTLLVSATLALAVSERRRELAGAGARRASLSVIIIACNEADRIARCLESVHGWADEIIVLDSGSQDDTVAVCRRYTPRVEQTDWPGFGVQKQRALDRASGDWVLSLDADEVVDPELRREIDFTLARPTPPHQGYALPWLTHVFATTLQHGHWARAPLRLFRRDCGRFTPSAVHEKIVLDPRCRIGRLQAPLHHYSYRDVEHARAKLSSYAQLQARERFGAGKRCRWPALAWIRAALNWVDNYLLRAAFLDGRGGWIMSRLTAAYTLEKYRALARLGRER